jgi:copper(I)-binding protein
MRSRRSILAVLLAGLLFGACSSAGASTAPSSGSVTVTDAWARATAVVDRPGGAYLVIHNDSGRADALTGASSPAAASVEVHETTMQSGGMMGMHAIPRLDVPAGATVRLEPGGYHLMLMGLAKPLAVGDTVELTLRFQEAGDITVKAAVREG